MEIGVKSCKKLPVFTKDLEISSPKMAFSTAEKRGMGIWLVDYTTGRKYQDSTWDDYGYLGQISTSNTGEVFVLPIPLINTLKEPATGYNSLYSINPTTGKLAPVIQFSKKQTELEQPYGGLGITFDCSANVVYVSSVYGSTKAQERGVIYAVDVASRSVIDSVEGIDAFGCLVLGVTGTKKLFYGSARTSTIYAIELDKSGKFMGTPSKQFTIDMLGPRGDDVAKKLTYKDNKLHVTGYEFSYTLHAPTEIEETYYQFSFDTSSKTWKHIP